MACCRHGCVCHFHAVPVAPADLGDWFFAFAAAFHLLLCSAADFDAPLLDAPRPEDHATPVMIALLLKQPAFAAALLNAGADPRIPNHRGVLPLDAAAALRYGAVIELISAKALALPPLVAVEAVSEGEQDYIARQLAPVWDLARATPQ